MAWTALAVFVGICVFAGYVIVHHRSFPVETVAVASSALLVEALGVTGTIWRATSTRASKEPDPGIGEQ